MSEQPRALRLAECLLRDRDMNWPDFENMQSAAAELRRLHSVNAGLLEALQRAINVLHATGAMDEARVAQDAISRAIGQ